MTPYKILAIAGLFVGVATSAVAGDLASSAVSGPVNWSGFYAGLQGGYANASAKADQTAGAQIFNRIGNDVSLSPNGLFGGGQVGMQRQSGAFVYGIEASLVGSDIDDLVRSPRISRATERLSLTSVHTVVGKIGYARDAILAYIKAGYAGGTTDFSAECAPCRNMKLPIDRDTYHKGFAFGGGIDWRFKDNWSLGLDYTHVDLRGNESTGTYSFNGRTPGVTGTFNTRADADMVGVRLNYYFGAVADRSPAPLK